MQLRGRKTLGILAAVWLCAACPRYTQQPPPHVEGSTVDGSAGATFASAGSVSHATRLSHEAHASERNPTCISGVIKTSGSLEIPVARARITVARGETTIGETMTDDNGRFSWCTPRVIDGSTVRASVHVEKSAFAASERELEITVGTTADLIIGLNPVP